MDLDTSNKLGRGKYSKVYKAFDRNNNRVVSTDCLFQLQESNNISGSSQGDRYPGVDDRCEDEVFAT